MEKIFAEQALTTQGWRSDVTVTVDDAGKIADLRPGRESSATATGVLLPAPGNLHSHTFQRAMAGLAERRGPSAGVDDFWSWRELMYRFLGHLTPEDIEQIADFAFMEMLEAGFASVGEFHYLHHQPDGRAYDNPAELSLRIIGAAARTGMGLTLLPVLYERGGCDGRPLFGGQQRFGNSLDRFIRLVENAAAVFGDLPADYAVGLAAHSLRAVSLESLAALVAHRPAAPLHIHAAEQVAETDEVAEAYGAPPVAWLLANHSVDQRWCLVHCTQMTASETRGLAASGAVAGLCPITEANLGDGIFHGRTFIEAGGAFGVGTDSNVSIGLAEELRQLEYSQRLRDRARAVLATDDRSCGRRLFEHAALGSHLALGRAGGALEVGLIADLMALDAGSVALAGCKGDTALDAYVFSGRNALVTDVWSAGRHVVKNGRHRDRDLITCRFLNVVMRLRGLL
jgi:formimidoylglutamate deiminase